MTHGFTWPTFLIQFLHFSSLRAMFHEASFCATCKCNFGQTRTWDMPTISLRLTPWLVYPKFRCKLRQELPCATWSVKCCHFVATQHNVTCNATFESSLLIQYFYTESFLLIQYFYSLQRKMSKSEIKRVYIVRPERKSIQKHLAKELGCKSKENTRVNAEVSFACVNSGHSYKEYNNYSPLPTKPQTKSDVELCLLFRVGYHSGPFAPGRQTETVAFLNHD